jgi:hypothetical protein
MGSPDIEQRDKKTGIVRFWYIYNQVTGERSNTLHLQEGSYYSPDPEMPKKCNYRITLQRRNLIQQ